MVQPARHILTIFVIVLLSISIRLSSAAITQDDLYRAMTLALLDEKDKLWQEYQSLTNHESSYIKSLWLQLISALPSLQHESRLQEFEKIKQLTADNNWEIFLKYKISSDELRLARRLQAKKFYTLFTGLFNYFSALASYALQGNIKFILPPVEPIVNILRLPSAMSPEDRAALILYKKSHSRYVDTNSDPKINKVIAQLSVKRRKYLTQENYNRAKLLLKTGHYDQALFFAQKALALSPESPKLNRLKNAILKEQALHQRHRALTLQVIDGETTLFPNNNDKLYHAIMCALLKQEELSLEKLLLASEPAALPAQFADEVALARSAKFSTANEKSMATQLLQQIAKEKTDTNTGKKVKALLNSPYFDAYTEFKHARKEANKDSLRYLFTSKMPAELQVDISMPLQPRALIDYLNDTFQVLFLPNTLFRGMKVVYTGSSVFYNKAIEAARRALRQETSPELQQGLYRLLAAWYEQQKRYEKAAEMYKGAGTLTERRQQKLTEKQARQLYRVAMNIASAKDKEKILGYVTAKFPQTKYAARSEKELAKLQKESEVLGQLSARELRVDPALQKLPALGLASELVDRDKQNNELNPPGITIYQDGLVTYMLCSGEKKQYQLDEEDLTLFKIILEEQAGKKAKLKALKDYFQRRKTLALEIRGSAGGSGVQAYPALQTLPYSVPEELVYR